MNSQKMWKFRRVAVVLGVAATLGVSGCRVHVDKDSNGKEKNVQVDTPFGGVHVNTDKTSAADLGLPVYPGATMVNEEDHKSADVHLGFGEWQLRVKVVSYATTDSQEKVAAFYKKALSRYGDVITCRDNAPVGTPAVTHEGLSCADDNSSAKVKIDEFKTDYKDNLELKAGSKRHQHIVGFESSKGDQIRFALVALDLPANIGSDEGKSN
ncbi:hypothetical protein [Acidicapsa ligni]|uniref:hypothetical protein n=1 Tax=Acidicapsa ligni TaxID=542300 RepID=UPI0021E0915F|nr:hypothetical protein [Acidicapsa ligni]